MQSILQEAFRAFKTGHNGMLGGRTTLSIMTLDMTTFSIIILSIKSFFVTLSINDTQHFNT
jgi:hypothetical protein